MTIVVDTHVHLYPCYDLASAMSNLVDNLAKLGGNAVKAAFLTERQDCAYFKDMQEGRLKIPGNRFEIGVGPDNALVLHEEHEPRVFLFPGRQIVTAERIEVLALTVDFTPTRTLRGEELVESILDRGGIPVLSWAPGKWMFDRGKTVRALIEKFEAGRLLIGDTTLRPAGWMESALIRMAKARGFPVVAGSDPLPFSGEERYMGAYASILNGDFDREHPIASIRKLLMVPGAKIARTGRRCNMVEVLRRLMRNAAAKTN